MQGKTIRVKIDLSLDPIFFAIKYQLFLPYYQIKNVYTEKARYFLKLKEKKGAIFNSNKSINIIPKLLRYQKLFIAYTIIT